MPHTPPSTFTAALFKSVYAIDVTDSHDWRILLFNIVSESLVAFTAGRYAVSLIPALAHLPGWFPGAGFKKIAEAGRCVAKQMFDLPFKMTKDSLVRGLLFSSAMRDV